MFQIKPDGFPSVMPKIFRSMRKADDEKPIVGASSHGLGVRIPGENQEADVDVDENGLVMLNSKGMSVSPGWRDLPYFCIPDRLRDQIPKARGRGPLFCFSMGEGPFENGPLTVDLDFVVDTVKHGLVTPRVAVTLAQLQEDIASTRDLWTIDED